MSQSNSFGSKTIVPTKNHIPPSRCHIQQWINFLFPSIRAQFTIQSLGSGEIYCGIMNRYFQGIISSNRIIKSPSNQYQYAINLKHFQNALTKVKFNINFDIQKVSKLRFSQNWSLIVSLYRLLETNEPIRDEKQIKTTKTPKRQLEQSQAIEENRCLAQNKNKPNELAKQNQLLGIGTILSQLQRVKEILLGSSNDTYKVMMIRHLFGTEQVKSGEVKVEEVEEVKPQLHQQCLNDGHKKN